MKYVVGYLGNNEFIEESLSKYYNPGENDKIQYLNLSNISEDRLRATAFNGIIYDTSMHDNKVTDLTLDNIIKSNAEIDIMPIINKDKTDPSFDELDELEAEIKIITERYNTSAIPYFVNSERETHLFMHSIFSTLSEKTIRHIEQVKKHMINSKNNILKVLNKVTTILELKDKYTKHHSLRVSNYAKQIGIKLGLPENQIETIAQAGMLHDIGKLAINDSVLLKPGKLDDDEFFHMRSHAEIGEILLDNLFESGEFDDIKDSVKHHHERYDGRGYPDKMEGENIPLHARILCLADSFDAMTTKRTYNNPKTLDEAISDLESNAGQQFDPKLVELFIELLRNEPEKLDITIDNGAIKVKYGPEEDKKVKEEQAKRTRRINEDESPMIK